MGKLTFTVDEDFKSVVRHAADNGLPLLLVKDQGVYLMPRTNGKPPVIAYADGMNPEKDDFDDWYDAAHDACGGDDFAEELTDVRIFEKFCEASKVIFSITSSHMSVRAG